MLIRALLTLTLLTPLAHAQSPGIIIDTDAGSDDILAIAFLRSHPSVHIDAITVANGLVIITNGYDANDQLLREVTQSGVNYTETNNYAYDNNGSMIGKTNIAAAAVNTNTYGYDLMNKLGSVALNGTVQASYQYNNQGIRVRATRDQVEERGDIAIGWHGLGEYLGELVAVGVLVIAGDGEQVGRHPGQIVCVRLEADQHTSQFVE